MSSKFATPFFQKSPLYGAYTSGADGMVTISDAPHYAKLQEDIGNAVSKAYAPKKNKCAKGAEYYFDKEGAKFPCNSKSKDSLTLSGVKTMNSISADAANAEEEDNMADIDSTGEFLQNEEKKDAAKLKQQKKKAANIYIPSSVFKF